MNRTAQRNLGIVLILAALLGMMTALAWSQTFSGTLKVDGQTYSVTGVASKAATTAPATQPAVAIPATKPVTTAPVAATQPIPPVAVKPSPVRPSIQTTGPPKGVVLRPSKGIAATAGQMIGGLDVAGVIDARAGGIEIRNSRIDARGAPHGVNAAGAAKPVLIENCEIFNATSALVYGQNVTVRNCYLHDSGSDGLKLGDNSLATGNLVARIGKAEGSHADGVQIRGGKNITINGNYFLQVPADGFHSNSAVFTQGASGRSTENVLVSGNWIDGNWNFALRLFSDGGDTKTLRAMNNLFYLGQFKFGAGSIEKGVVWSGNIDQTGKPVLTSSK